MPSSTCHLPNGNSFSVTPVFGGVNFKSNDLNLHHSAFPPGWTVAIHTEKPVDEGRESHSDTKQDGQGKVRQSSFKQPTRQNDCIFISSISNPSSMDYKPPISPSRQIAMMLWATLWWYFHEPEPDLHLPATAASAATPVSGRPRGDWRVNIKREGIFQGRNMMQKMERMGLIANEDSSVGTESIESRAPASWERMFTSRRSFWQLDPRIFLFTLIPAVPSLSASSSSPMISPYGSRPASPNIDFFRTGGDGSSAPSWDQQHSQTHAQNAANGPYTSSSHLPTYYPPPPTQYIFANGVRHPLRPRPPHQGETFYSRYIPSVGQYLSFRVPVLGPAKPKSNIAPNCSSLTVPRINSPPPGPSDLDYLHKWMNDPRVNSSWGEAGPREKQEKFLVDGLSSRHSFPVFGCWDGKPFGYFEIYWVKEDRLGRNIGHVGNYDRGLHLLIGEQEFRGPHRVPLWLSSLVHYCWLADFRTEAVLLEPRVDNQKIIGYLTDAGFYKEGEVSLPHKQSAVMRINRDSWESPAL
ncbi:Putative lysine N-acyltransferase C17G9,06c [Talaromyces islandicus]|uniref:Putative lysine N-acyltransferase C17G9,06c n=1 Tax=Talaromyces islandicus TaxID=28573 RepID=A0A0U1M435_TALIS|nr:Putative lysine N-acyltransferase C17G9,06c [Talaromyces islandicus]